MGQIYTPFCEFENDIKSNQMYIIEDENKIINISMTLK